MVALMFAATGLTAEGQTTATGGGYFYVVTPRGDTLSQHSTQRAATDQLYFAMLLARRDGRPTTGYRILRELELRGDLSMFEPALPRDGATRVDTVEVRDTVWLGGDTTVVVIRFAGGDTTAPGPADTLDLLYATDFEDGQLPPSFEARGWVFAQGGIHAVFEAGQEDAGSIKMAVGRAPPDGYRDGNPIGDAARAYTELEYCMDVRYMGPSRDWPAKLARSAVFFTPDHWGEAAIAHLWQVGDGPHLGGDPTTLVTNGRPTSTDYNDWDAMRWLGQMQVPVDVADGQWHRVCALQRLNTPGRADGVFSVTVDGTERRRDDVDWRGSWSGPYGWNVLMLEAFDNGGASGRQGISIDNLVIRGR